MTKFSNSKLPSFSKIFNFWGLKKVVKMSKITKNNMDCFTWCLHYYWKWYDTNRAPGAHMASGICFKITYFWYTKKYVMSKQMSEFIWFWPKKSKALKKIFPEKNFQLFFYFVYYTKVGYLIFFSERFEVWKVIFQCETWKNM